VFRFSKMKISEPGSGFKNFETGSDSVKVTPVPVFYISVELIKDFCDPQAVHHFYCVVQSHSNPIALFKYLIRSEEYPIKL